MTMVGGFGMWADRLELAHGAARDARRFLSEQGATGEAAEPGGLGHVAGPSRPRFFAERDRYRFSFEVQKDQARALIDGTTPCVKTP